MMRNYTVNNKQNGAYNPDEALKTTSQQYLIDALQKQEYERCAELIKTVKYYGATDEEIQKVLTENALGLSRGTGKSNKIVKRF